MQLEKEITVKVNMSKENLIELLEKDDYKKIDSYIVDDIYYVKEDANLNENPLDLLSKSVMVRSIDNEKHYLMYKYKKYDENENLLEQGKVKVEVTSRKDAKELLNRIGYKELISVLDNIDVYEKDGLEVVIEDVNDKYLFIEVEENDKYDSIEKMIQALENTKIDFDRSNYSVRKAKLIFEEKYRK